MDSETCVSGYMEHLEIDGQIGPDSTEALSRLLPKLPKCIDGDGTWLANRVYLSSRGGLLSDGFALGRLFRKYQMETVITYGQECSSSCAIAFLGGIYRSMRDDAKLMFHAPYTTNQYWDRVAIDCSDYGQVSDLADYYKFALGAEAGNYLKDRTMSYCSRSDGWTLNADGAQLLGLLNDG